jgi:nucleoside-diphosphate-sugar epimerase
MGPKLEAAGYEVVGLDTIYYGDRCTFIWEQSSIPTIRKDIRDVTAQDLRGYDALIHRAALSNDPLGNLQEGLTYDINHHASVRLARLAKESGISRFLFSSSCSMHGTSTAAKVTETTPVHPITPYGDSKIKAEQEISALAGDGFSPVFLRNGTVFGVSPKLRVDIVLNNLVGWACTTGKVKLYTDGTPWRPLVHVEDVSDAFIAVLQAPVEAVHNEVFHVGSNQANYRIRDVAEIVRSVVPGCDLEFDKDHEGDQRTYIADFSKIEEVLPQFQPRWTVEDGARQLYQAYQLANLSLEDFTGSSYIRLKHVGDLLRAGMLGDDLRWQRFREKTP